MKQAPKIFGEFFIYSLTYLLIGSSVVMPIMVFAKPIVSSTTNTVTSYVPTSLATSTLFNGYGNTSMEKPMGLSSCFDHYHFNSTPVELKSSLSQVAAGSDFAFTGSIKNENSYAIPHASLWIKVLRVKGPAKSENGPDVVDWFNVTPDITLPANGTVPISGSWKVPVDIKNGTYQFATFVIQSDRFNFEGLSFTDDIVGAGLSFSVVSGSTNEVEFSKDSIQAVGYPFSFAEFPPVIPAGQHADVQATVINNRTVAFKGDVVWKLYSWDAVKGDHLLDTKTIAQKIQPNSSSTISYTITDATHSVYYLVGSLTSEQGTKSIIGMRLVREGVSTPRLNYVGIDPGTDPHNAIAVACVHSTGKTPSLDGKVTLMVYRSGIIGSFLNLFGPLASASYQGAIAPNIYALTVPVDALNTSVITAKLYQKDVLVDEVSEPYCSANTCNTNENIPWIGVVVSVVILLAIILIAVFVSRSSKSSQQIP
jgi:hypothetical protein